MKSRKPNSVIKSKDILGWVVTTPYMLFSLFFFLIPLCWAFYLSFTDWNLISPAYNMVGVKNFLTLLKDKGVRSAFFVTYKFFLMFVPGVLVMALTLAMIIHHLPRFKTVFIVGYFLPYLASGVASSIVVRGLLSYDSPVNIWLRKSFSLNIDWLNSTFFTPIVLVGMMVWKFSGYYALIVESGLESISTEVYEAAAIDGCTGIRKFFTITLPLLYPAFYTVCILATGVVFHIFTEPYVLTNGGPSGATNTWMLEIYNQAFNKLNTGYGTAIAITNAVITFFSILVIRKILEKWGEKNGW